MTRGLPFFGLALVLLATPACRERSKATIATDVAVGSEFACARLTDGAVRCWGGRALGRLGQGANHAQGPGVLQAVVPRGLTGTGPARPEPVINLGDVVEIVAGEAHACARLTPGSVSCWGSNEETQLARPSSTPYLPYPVPISEIADATQLTAGDKYTCARRKDGTVWCWGDWAEGVTGRESGRLGAVPGLTSAREVRAAGKRVCALLEDGTVRCWGRSLSGVAPMQDLREVVQIAVGPNHACARKKDGTVACWGSNEMGQMADGTSGPGNVRPAPVTIPRLLGASQVFVGSSTTCGRLNDSRLVCYGAKRGTGWEIPGLRTAGEIELSVAGQSETDPGCAVLNNGALMCWGSAWLGVSPTSIPQQVRW